MRTWMKVTLGGVTLIAVALVALTGTGAYFVFRHMDKRTGSETEAVREIDSVKARFAQRPPLVEIVDAQRADIRINRSADTSRARVDTVHIINWKSETSEVIRFAVPLWLMRFSSVNILSQLGIAPENFRLTVSDIERHGPGIVVDYGPPRAFRVLVWVE
jgi:hypothetical protein